MKVYIRPSCEGDTFIDGIVHGLDAETLYVIWKSDLAHSAQCYIYIERNGVMSKIRAGELHEKTFEELIVDSLEADTPIPFAVADTDPPCGFGD